LKTSVPCYDVAGSRAPFHSSAPRQFYFKSETRFNGPLDAASGWPVVCFSPRYFLRSRAPPHYHLISSIPVLQIVFGGSHPPHPFYAPGFTHGGTPQLRLFSSPHPMVPTVRPPGLWERRLGETGPPNVDPATPRFHLEKPSTSPPGAPIPFSSESRGGPPRRKSSPRFASTPTRLGSGPETPNSAVDPNGHPVNADPPQVCRWTPHARRVRNGRRPMAIQMGPQRRIAGPGPPGGRTGGPPRPSRAGRGTGGGIPNLMESMLEPVKFPLQSALANDPDEVAFWPVRFLGVLFPPAKPPKKAAFDHRGPRPGLAGFVPPSECRLDNGRGF